MTGHGRHPPHHHEARQAGAARRLAAHPALVRRRVPGAGADAGRRFRLDDPEGEVGIEFIVVTDASGGEPVAYLVPLTYRGAPLEGAEAGLVGTSEHGVLGTRWIYDGAHDPVFTERLLALLRGAAEPQQQSVTDAADPTVVAESDGEVLPAGAVVVAVEDGPDGTRLAVEADGRRFGLELVRVLGAGRAAPGTLGRVTAGWELPDGTARRGPVAVLYAG